MCTVSIGSLHVAKGKAVVGNTFQGIHNNISIHFWYNSLVFNIAYCQPFHYNKQEEFQQICQDFVNTVKENSPELLKKLKIHLILHLVQSMCDFGPTSAFNTERFIKIVCIYNVVSLFCSLTH